MTGNLNFVIIFVLDILVGTRDVSSSSVINFIQKNTTSRVCLSYDQDSGIL